MTTKKTLSRRQLLHRAACLSMAGALTLASGCGKNGKNASPACSDPNQLNDSENSIRASLNYTETSSSKEQVCSSCGFFDASTGNPCGTCELLKGPVNPSGHCDSWSEAKLG